MCNETSLTSVALTVLKLSSNENMSITLIPYAKLISNKPYSNSIAFVIVSAPCVFRSPAPIEYWPQRLCQGTRKIGTLERQTYAVDCVIATGVKGNKYHTLKGIAQFPP